MSAAVWIALIAVFIALIPVFILGNKSKQQNDGSGGESGNSSDSCDSGNGDCGGGD